MTAPLPLEDRTRFLWTPEADATALRMVKGGHSRSSVANALGLSRNAVIGRLNRLQKADGIVRKKATAKGRKSKPVVERRAMPGLLYGFPKFSDAAPAAFDEPTTDTAVRLKDVRLFDCRWPLGDSSDAEAFRFCGAPSTSGPYCIHHAQIAYRRAA